MPRRGDITKYQKDVERDVSKVLGVRAQLRYLGTGDWWEARGPAGIAFGLMPLDLAAGETAPRGRAGKKRPVRVLLLNPDSSSCLGTFWVSWHESWKKESSDTFALTTAGWTLFEGPPGYLDKAQVLRLDWNHEPPTPGRRSAYSGHPHWHFDHLLFERQEPAKPVAAQDLVELPGVSADTGSSELSVGFIHLAMGAWTQGVDHPQCWQRTYEDDCSNLLDWCVKTLRYLKDQIQRE